MPRTVRVCRRCSGCSSRSGSGPAGRHGRSRQRSSIGAGSGTTAASCAALGTVERSIDGASSRKPPPRRTRPCSGCRPNVLWTGRPSTVYASTSGPASSAAMPRTRSSISSPAATDPVREGVTSRAAQPSPSRRKSSRTWALAGRIPRRAPKLSPGRAGRVRSIERYATIGRTVARALGTVDVQQARQSNARALRRRMVAVWGWSVVMGSSWWSGPEEVPCGAAPLGAHRSVDRGRP